MSGFDLNASTHNVSHPSEGDSIAEHLPIDNPTPPRPEREGLPRGYRMRADAHYVDQLTSRSTAQPIRMVPIDEIQLADRSRAGDEAVDLQPLIKSIRAHGVVHPLFVHRRSGGYDVIAGAKRLQAARLAGCSSIPCIVHDADEKQAAALAEADNLVVTPPRRVDRTVLMLSATRRVISGHLATVQTTSELLGTAAPSMRRATLDLVQAHAWRAARWLDLVAVVNGESSRPARARSIHSVVDDFAEGFAPESRLTGVQLHVQTGDGLSNSSSGLAKHDDVFGALTGGLFSLVPFAEHDERSTVIVKLSGGFGATTIEMHLQASTPVPADFARRFFDETSSDRPGGWAAVLAARATALVAERRHGTAAFEVDEVGEGFIRITLPRPVLTS